MAENIGVEPMRPSMRTQIFDWLLAVSDTEGFCRQTYSLASCYFDLVLSRQFVEVPKLQLLAVTCLWIAMKNEEEYFTPVKRFSKATKFFYDTD